MPLQKYRFNKLLRTLLLNKWFLDSDQEGENMRNMRQRYKCDDCGFTTTSDYVLEAHIKFAHKLKEKTRANVTKRKTCEECGKRFNKDSTFKKHMTTIHGVADVEMGQFNLI